MSYAREIAKPFVAWMSEWSVEQRSGWADTERSTHYPVPVVVTPLLPDDPRPGEVWIDDSGDSVEILAGPVKHPEHGQQVVVGICRKPDRQDAAGFLYSFDPARLRRPPVLKTFRMTWISGDGQGLTCQSSIQAESREAALANLASALEEVAE